MSHRSALRSSPVARTVAQAALFLALPFAMLPWLVPFASPLTIGADYPVYSIAHQMILQLSLRNGTFPLFVPGFAYGQSAAAATLGQLFHPLSHVAAHLPGYWTGHALDVVTVLNLLSLGAAQLALYRVLREPGTRAVPAFLASCVAVWNLRTLDLFRYGASLQNGVGLLLACAAELHLALRGPSAARIAALAVATFLLLCGGHPQMAYLGMGGAVVLGLAAPFLADALRPPQAARRDARAQRAALAAIAAGLAIGVLLAAAYLMPLWADFAHDATSRTARDFRWVWWPYGTASPWTLADDLVRPLHADVHGAFGGSALLVVPLLVPLLAVVRPLPRVVWALWGFAALTLATALSPGLPLYRLLWTVLPGFASFRVPGRVTMVLPLTLALLLLWLLERGDDAMVRARRRPSMLLATLAFAVCAAYGALRGGAVDPAELAPPLAIRHVPAAVVIAVPALGLASLAALALFVHRPQRLAAALLVASVLVQQALVLGFGTWVTARQPTPTYAALMQRQRDHLGFDGPAGAGMEPDVVVRYAQQGGRIGVGPLARLDTGTTSGRPGRTELLHAAFNRVVFRTRSPAAAVLEVRYPFSDRWQARVDGAPTRLAERDTPWLGVPVPAGPSVVELRYVSPAAIVGVLVSLVTAWSLAVAVIVCSPRLAHHRARRALAVATVTTCAVATVLLWQRSLYGGAHLGTRFTWPPPASLVFPAPRALPRS